jgi:hypothetical protein
MCPSAVGGIVAKLIFKNGPYADKSVSLPDGKSITLGRNRDIELPLPDLKLSRRHCQITVTAGRGAIKDLGSTNGTFVNGARLSETEVELNDFDRIVLGDTEIEFHGDEEEAPLPKPFDAGQTDPFELGDGDVLPDEEVPPVPAVPKLNPNIPKAPPQSREAAPRLELEMEVDLEVDPEPVAPGVPMMPAASTIPAAPMVRGPVYHAPPIAAPIPAPVAAPVVAEAVQDEVEIEIDPFEAALADLRRPLPPEPPGSQSTAAAVKMKAQVRFCDVCSGSIPVLDWDLGQAKLINGATVCKECMAKGATVPTGVTPESPAPRSVPKKNSLDDILAGLEQEAVIVDTSVKRRGTSLDEQEAARKIGQIQQLQQATAVRPNSERPAVKKPAKSADKDLVDSLGDEFEEIG